MCGTGAHTHLNFLSCGVWPWVRRSDVTNTGALGPIDAPATRSGRHPARRGGDWAVKRPSMGDRANRWEMTRRNERLQGRERPCRGNTAAVDARYDAGGTGGDWRNGGCDDIVAGAPGWCAAIGRRPRDAAGCVHMRVRMWGPRRSCCSAACRQRSVACRRAPRRVPQRVVRGRAKRAVARAHFRHYGADTDNSDSTGGRRAKLPRARYMASGLVGDGASMGASVLCRFAV